MMILSNIIQICIKISPVTPNPNLKNTTEPENLNAYPNILLLKSDCKLIYSIIQQINYIVSEV